MVDVSGCGVGLSTGLGGFGFQRCRMAGHALRVIEGALPRSNSRMRMLAQSIIAAREPACVAA
jgi:hypothetical protein